jgi:hypothetical protein
VGRNEKVGATSARDEYGVVLAHDGSVDDAATAALRGSRAAQASA